MLELDEEQESLIENIFRKFQDGQAWSDGALTWEEIEERRTKRLSEDIIDKTRQETV